MLGTGIDEQFFEHLASEAILRQHTFDGPFDHGVRAAAEEVLGDLFLLATGITGEIDVDLVLRFVAGKDNFVRIDDDDEIAAVYVRGVIGLVLTAENGGDPGTHATYGLISTVHDIPVALNGSLVRVFGGEM